MTNLDCVSRPSDAFFASTELWRPHDDIGKESIDLQRLKSIGNISGAKGLKALKKRRRRRHFGKVREGEK